MRPGRYAPDNPGAGNAILRGHIASMRQGRYAPDNRPHRRGGLLGRAASMRPGRYAPDNAWRPPASVPDANCFNEAGALCPG